MLNTTLMSTVVSRDEVQFANYGLTIFSGAIFCELIIFLQVDDDDILYFQALLFLSGRGW